MSNVHNLKLSEGQAGHILRANARLGRIHFAADGSASLELVACSDSIAGAAVEGARAAVELRARKLQGGPVATAGKSQAGGTP
jgi:hypothetical protein